MALYKKVICEKCGMVTANSYIVPMVEAQALLDKPPLTHKENDCNGNLVGYIGPKEPTDD